MSRGIIYYNKGTKCLVRAAVSIYTLRRSGYTGPLCVIHEGEISEWFVECVRRFGGCQFVRIPPAEESRWALVQKPSLWRYTPFKTSLYIDADTVVLKDPSELFDVIERKGFAVTRFCDWTTDGGRIISGRINTWRSIIGEDECAKARAFGPAVNTGVFGWSQGHPILPEWERITRAGDAKREQDGPMSRIIDETACQVLMHRFDADIIGEEWNYSVNHSHGRRSYIIHYHGGKHVLPENHHCNHWKDAWWEMVKLGVVSSQMDCLDKRTTHYLHTGSKKYGYPGVLQRADDLTIVTAADPNYAARLTRNFARWMKLDALYSQRFVVMCINADPGDKAYDGLRKHSNVSLVRYDAKAKTIREAAFESFVFGVARHVKTKYWMKLDADAEPTELGRLDWPGYRRFTITADPWHYTKVKGDDSGGPHWLNRLDAWWAKLPGVEDRAPLFPDIEGRRHMHKRLRSFAWIERTEFTRQCAALYGDRLPIPSHDTSQWYVAARLGEVMCPFHFRRYIRA